MMNKVSGVALLIMLVTGLGLNLSNIINLIGSFGFLALILFVVGSLLIGMLWAAAIRPSAACWGWPQRSAMWPPPSWSPA